MFSVCVYKPLLVFALDCHVLTLCVANNLKPSGPQSNVVAVHSTGAQTRLVYVLISPIVHCVLILQVYRVHFIQWKWCVGCSKSLYGREIDSMGNLA